MSISVTPSLPKIAVESAAPDLLLQPGSIVDAKVLKVLSANLVRIAISNVSIDVLSEIPLIAGQALQLAVSQTEAGIRLAVVGQGAASATSSDTVALAPNATVVATANALPLPPSASNALTPLERVAVSAAAESAAIQQESLAPLFANLAAVAGSTNFPAKLQQAIMQVLEQRTSFDPALSGSDVKNAFQKSGIFLEASLASGSVSPASGVPDLKAALIVLRQTLLSTVNSAGEPSTSSPMAGAPQPIMPAVTDASATAVTVRSAGATPTLVPSISPELELQELLLPRAPLPLAGDALRSGSTAEVVISASARKAGLRAPAADAALKLLTEMLQPTARTMGNASLPASTLQRARGDDLTLHTNTPPPPFRGALPSAQPVAAPSITSNAPLATSAHHLLDDTDAAIARQTLLQAASLPDRAETSGVRSDPVTPRWNFEIPFATAQGTAMAQFEISRDGGGNEVEAATRVWRARFSLDVEPAGPVHAVVSLSGERTSVRIWAERPATAAQLRAGAAQLSQALGKAELQPGDIVIREGAPPAQPAARAGHFLDRAL